MEHIPPFPLDAVLTKKKHTFKFIFTIRSILPDVHARKIIILTICIALHEEMDGKEYVVEFDFLGKDSIRYYNKVPVEKQVFKNLKLFMDNKDPGDDLFDRLTVSTTTKIKY